MGCASATVRSSQFCTRGVAPSMEKFQSSGQWNTPSARGKRDPRNSKESRGALRDEVSSRCTATDLEAQEIWVGAISIPPCETLAFKAPIRNGAEKDFAASVPPTLAMPPC